jgi:hypothetical protein
LGEYAGLKLKVERVGGGNQEEEMRQMDTYGYGIGIHNLPRGSVRFRCRDSDGEREIRRLATETMNIYDMKT